MKNKFDLMHKILIVLVCTLILVPWAIGVSIAQENVSIEEKIDVVDSTTPRGWINAVNSNSIIIDDTLYLFAGTTRYPDGKNKLKEGEFVRFKLQKDNILAEISLAEPLREDMYMKPIVRNKDGGANASEAEDSGEKGPDNGGPGGMRLENGVWVN